MMTKPCPQPNRAAGFPTPRIGDRADSAAYPSGARGEAFRDSIRERAREYFETRARRTHGSLTWQVAAGLGFLALGVLLVFAFVFGSLWAALAHGILRGLMVVGPGHAMTHFSLFSSRRRNVLAFRISAPLLISNVHFWTASHVVGHHVHTMTASDPQLNYPLKRVRQAQAWRPFHQVQHIYMWLVYMLAVPLWCLCDLLLAGAAICTGRFAGKRLALGQGIEALIVTTANLATSLALPFLVLEFPTAAAVFLISTIPCSLIITLQNVVNHEVTDVADAREDACWDVSQVVASHNYAADSPWALYLSGGLNLQIEHHLFPSVHYSHYAGLKRIVQEACAEHGIPYASSSTFREALGKHHRLLSLRARGPVRTEASRRAAPCVSRRPT